MNKHRIGTDNICPETGKPCLDECCPPGAICNLSDSLFQPEPKKRGLIPAGSGADDMGVGIALGCLKWVAIIVTIIVLIAVVLTKIF